MQKSSRPILYWTLLLCLSGLSEAAFAAKRDFKGLFGSYRREKFTENEARSSDFGVDLMLSTLLPMTPLVSSVETTGGALQPMQTSTFFNVELNFFYTIAYNWEIYASIGHYDYETRKENTVYTQVEKPLFHQFEMSAVPLILGLKYRFSTDDIVPYVGMGLGMSYVRRKGFYDYSLATYDEEFSTAITAQVHAGVEFYFSSRAGLRLEMSSLYIRLPARQFDPTGTGNIGSLPIITYEGNPWLIRYASGFFILF